MARDIAPTLERRRSRDCSASRGQHIIYGAVSGQRPRGPHMNFAPLLPPIAAYFSTCVPQHLGLAARLDWRASLWIIGQHRFHGSLLAGVDVRGRALLARCAAGQPITLALIRGSRESCRDHHAPLWTRTRKSAPNCNLAAQRRRQISFKCSSNPKEAVLATLSPGCPQDRYSRSAKIPAPSECY